MGLGIFPYPESNPLREKIIFIKYSVYFLKPTYPNQYDAEMIYGKMRMTKFVDAKIRFMATAAQHILPVSYLFLANVSLARESLLLGSKWNLGPRLSD